MVQTWPSSLPLKVRYGSEFEYGLEGAKAITEFENGPFLMRQRFTNVPYRMVAVQKWTDADFERFMTFYTHTLLNGTRSFIAPVLAVNTILYLRCQIVDRSIKPTAEDFNRWSVPITFEIRGDYAVGEEVYYLYDAWGPVKLESFMDRTDYEVNPHMAAAVDDWN
jgi:hypothetical protein